MIEREYRLYARDEGPYELVPQGYSVLAMFLQLFWAIANGVFLKFVCLFIPIIILGNVAESIPGVGSFILMPYIFLAFLVYFPLRAFAWREKVLTNKGYKLITSVRAKSAQAALQKYSESVPAS
tara:strand:- start:177 stop:548 length:372 start_codon:yes stop_codon:yes gene_type:complete